MNQQIDYQPGINYVRAARVAMGAHPDAPLANSQPYPSAAATLAARTSAAERSFAYADGTIHYPSKTGMRERDAQRDSFLRGGSQFTGFQSQRTRQTAPSLSQRFLGSLRRTFRRKRETSVFFNMSHARSGKVTEPHFFVPPGSVSGSVIDSQAPTSTAPPRYASGSVFSQFTEHVDAPTPVSTRPPSLYSNAVIAPPAVNVPPQAAPAPDFGASVSSYVRPARTVSNSSGLGFRAASRRPSAATSRHSSAKTSSTTTQPAMRKPVDVLRDSDQLAQRYRDRLRNMHDASGAASPSHGRTQKDDPAVSVQHPSAGNKKQPSDSGSEFGFATDGTPKRPHSWELQDMLKQRRERTASQQTNEVLNNWSSSSDEEDVPAPLPATVPATPIKAPSPRRAPIQTKTPKVPSPKIATPKLSGDPDRPLFGELFNSARRVSHSAKKNLARAGSSRLTPKTVSQRQFSHNMRQTRLGSGKKVSSAIRTYEERVAKESFESQRAAAVQQQTFRGTVPRSSQVPFDLEEAVQEQFGPVDAWRATVHDQTYNLFETGSMLL